VRPIAFHRRTCGSSTTSAAQFRGRIFTMSWADVIADRIQQNLKWSPASEAVKEQIVAEAIAEFENLPAPEETKPEEEEPLTMRGEKLSDLRAKARKWAGWEDWSK
jgi:hypothetical protein